MQNVNCKIEYRLRMPGLLLLAWLIFCQGCGGSTEKSLWRQIADLGNQKSTLGIQVEKLQQENEQLRQQVVTLQGLDSKERLEVIDAVEKIAISSRTGLYDKDNDGKMETLVVYIEPTDTTGDRVKAPGSVDVRLWNLNAQNTQNALLKQWTLDPMELKKTWSATVMTYYYRLSFKVDDIIKGDETELTVKVKFTDYFSGKVLEDQRAIQ